jgi:hypothetical protein
MRIILTAIACAALATPAFAQQGPAVGVPGTPISRDQLQTSLDLKANSARLDSEIANLVSTETARLNAILSGQTAFTSQRIQANPVMATCPVGNCPIPGTPGYGGAYAGPTLSTQWVYGQSTADQKPQFLSNIGLYVKDDGTERGQYVTQYLGAMQGPTAGSTWSLNTDIVRGACAGGTYSIGGQPGSGIPFGDAGCTAAPGSLGRVSTFGYEMDVGNLDADTANSGAQITGLYINTLSRYTSSQGIFLTAGLGQTVPSWHNGLEFGTLSVKDRSVFDYSGSESGWVSGGAHANASFWDVSTGRYAIRLEGTKSEADINSSSTSPAFLANTAVKSAGVFVESSNSATVFAVSGGHSNVTFNDTSTTPAALGLSGTYSVAAIYTGGATTNAALVAAPGQSICLGGGGVGCVSYNATTGKLLFVTNGTTLMSLDNSGNLIVKGTVTQGQLP